MILAFDTSGPHCAGAVLSGDKVVAQGIEPMTRGQVERLMPFLEELLAECGVGWRDLSRIGVGVGPGNFTGIRISVSAARGLALGLGVPAIGVSSFDALAFGQTGDVLASVDARAGGIYTRLGTAPPEIHPSDDFRHLPAAPTLGHRADEIARRTGGRSVNPVCPLAEAIARIAQQRAVTAGLRPAPLYIRPADAAPPRHAAPEIAP